MITVNVEIGWLCDKAQIQCNALVCDKFRGVTPIATVTSVVTIRALAFYFVHFYSVYLLTLLAFILMSAEWFNPAREYVSHINYFVPKIWRIKKFKVWTSNMRCRFIFVLVRTQKSYSISIVDIGLSILPLSKNRDSDFCSLYFHFVMIFRTLFLCHI